MDKIIEECDDDQQNNATKGLLKDTSVFVEQQVKKIEQDELKVELDIKQDGDFEYQLKFEEAFYSKESVKKVQDDQYNLRNKIKDVIGQ